MAQYKLRKSNSKLFLWGTVLLLTVLTVLLSLWFMSPPPPKSIRFASGQPTGAYHAFARDYANRLGPMGLRVAVLDTKGSIDNYERLIKGEADVAFAQSGTYDLVKDQDTQKVLRGMAAVYLEPLWVFYRAENHVGGLADFKGKSISIGPAGSGTEAVSKLLLEKDGINADNATLKNLSTAEARQQLQDGKLDVAMFVSSYKDPTIVELQKLPQIHLLSFRRDVAYARQFAYLTPVKLAEGVLDLEHNIPSEDKTLLAPAALLVCRKDLHPQVVDEILKAAKEIHAKGSLMDPPLKYPSLEGIDGDLPIDDAADTYMKQGEPFLSKVLPYWAVRWLLRLKILIIPLLAVWVPFLKVLPMIYAWRVNRILHHHYAVLREVETNIAHAERPEQLREWLQELDAMRAQMEGLSRKIPARLQRDVYDWRLHVALVRSEVVDRLRRLEAPAETVVS
jgi:TRAP transporter TAXI family solute receptor